MNRLSRTLLLVLLGFSAMASAQTFPWDDPVIRKIWSEEIEGGMSKVKPR